MKTKRIHIELLEARIAPARLTTLTWQGDLATTGWDDGTVGTNTNWISNLGEHRIPVDGNVLVFPAGAANKTNVNDITGLDVRTLVFNGTGYNITGNAITLSTGMTANVSGAGSNSFHPTITLAADQTLNSGATAGAVFQFDEFVLAGKTVTVDGAGTVRFGTLAGTKLTGAGAIIKNGAGVLLIGDGNDFTGPVQVNAGTVNLGAIGGLGAAGAGNGTTVASGASLSLPGNTTEEDFTVSGNGTAGQAGAIFAGLTNNTLTGAIRLGADATIEQATGSGGSLTLTGALGAADDALGILTIRMDNAANNFALAASVTLTTELAGTTPGATGHDQLKVVGKINLAGATLNVVPSFTPQVGDTFTIVENDAIEDIVGTFAGLAQGAAFTAGGVNFKIIYNGGDGNDVVLSVESLVNPPVPVTLSNGGKTATFTDVDGDLVTVKTDKGPFLESDFSVVGPGVGGGGQLQQINLTTRAADFTGAKLTVSATPGPLGGNGFVNVGYVNATGIDLGKVKIAGDLGRILAGTVGGDASVPALASLKVGSIGLLGTSTQAAGGNLRTSILEGALPVLTVAGDVRKSLFLLNGTDARLGTVTLGGSLIGDGDRSSLFIAAGGIGAVAIGGDIRHSDGVIFADSGFISGRAIGSISVNGSITGGSSSGVIIQAFGKTDSPADGVDTALKSLTVGGSVEKLAVAVGFHIANADAAIGSITVGGDWISSSVQAGTTSGADNRIGTADDAKIAGRDSDALFSTIGSFVVKGQALGSGGATGDMFGIVAERIGKAKVGGIKFAFADDATPEAFFAAPTGAGSGTENPAFDFAIREIGSTTPTVALGVNFLLGDGKTVSFTDVDGDSVTVTRSKGAFLAGDFTFAATTSSGGGQLERLVFSSNSTEAADLTITAQPSALGGNGFVNVGSILAIGTSKLGAVSIDGDLGQLTASGGFVSLTDIAIGSLSVHSFGQLGLATGAIDNTVVVSTQFPKFTIATDFRGGTIISTGAVGPDIGKLTIGGAFIGGAIQSGLGIGTMKIGGSLRGGNIAVSNGAINALTVGGDIVGTASSPVFISVFGQQATPTTGLDLAIGSLDVKGSIDNARIEAGIGTFKNADASIGAISVGRAWLASSALAGVKAGVDGFTGTADDTKITAAVGVVRDFALVSTIASIKIKGQAFGSVAAGDSFGIVAEEIGKAKLGKGATAFKVILPLDPGERDAADAFAIAPTGPGAGVLPFDFFIRELIV